MVTESRRGLAGNVESMGVKKNAYKLLREKLEERRTLG
jgi:hypothetical protein